MESISKYILGAFSTTALTFAGYQLILAFFNVYFHPLRGFPGPKFAAASRLPYLYLSISGQLPLAIKELHDKYGDVIRIAPNELTYREPSAWKYIYRHRKHTAKPLVKDPYFYDLPPNGAATITYSNEADHSRQRRLLSHAFSDKALREQEVLIRSYVDLLISKLREITTAGNSGVKIDLVRWYNYTTFDMIGDLTFGESFGCLEDNRYHPWVSLIFDTVRVLPYLSAIKYFPMVSLLIRIAMPKRFKQSSADHFEFSAAKLGRRLESKAQHADFMSHILKPNDKFSMTRAEMDANASVLIFAGSETTATLLSGCTFYLLKNPVAYGRLTQDIRSLKAEELTFAKLEKLSFLHAILQESLRMYTPVPIGLPRLVPDGGATISGHFVPAGTILSVNQWSAYRAATNFAEPDHFWPERWLENCDEKFLCDRKTALQPFSTGPRNCLGKNLAYAEMRLILAKLLWHYDLELCPETVNWADQKVFILWEKHPPLVKLKPVLH
ncbi:hypothetical protein OIDMADRAFT_55967 [Oidiodendron maius Zn]|uniref:Cytochrome P450 monooxygenase n=1 Tax=Oidiodendron maius (strain Zn) TaxID=913774 RepID=A0A0C3GVF4_OIDMZ|nr:hypothetical protein OIDMADRAFT_55967 [Oidiodendron maius Zn]